jgi:protein gp37
MAETSKISWTHATFNPWRGCTKVSPGCANCYAEAQSKRNPKVLGVWGDKGTRVIAGEDYWRQPVKWNAAAGERGERMRVFCASLADWLEDRPELADPRRRLAKLIRQTPNLDWLLLTKRPWNLNDAAGLMDWELDGIPDNVWLGVSVENREHGLPRIDAIRRVMATVRFLSIEPLLEDLGPVDLTGIHWVIIGGESGPHARPCNLAWIRSLVKQCEAAGVACFVKQLGGKPVEDAGFPAPCKVRLLDRKGGDMDEWPRDLRVQQFPEVLP